MRPHFLLDRAGGGARRRPSSPVRAELREPRLALLQLRAEHEAAAALCLKVGLRSCRASVRGAGRPPHAGRRRATPTLTLTLTLTLALAIAFEARGGAPLNSHVAVEPELHEVGLQVGVRHVQQHLYGTRDRSLSARARKVRLAGAPERTVEAPLFWRPESHNT